MCPDTQERQGQSPPKGGRGLSLECTLELSKGLKQSEIAGEAHPMESSLSVCMLHTEGELATLQLPCASSSSAMLSRLMSVAIDCTTS